MRLIQVKAFPVFSYWCTSCNKVHTTYTNGLFERPKYDPAFSNVEKTGEYYCSHCIKKFETPEHTIIREERKP